MPDPLLTAAELEAEFLRARTVAERFNAILSRQGEFIFLECQDPAGRRLLARIDCKGYPGQPPDAAFLDPTAGKRADVPASTDLAHWPKGHAPLIRQGRAGLCLGGTRTYLLAHRDAGFVIGLGELVATLVMCCRGQARALAARSRRRARA